MRGSRPNAPHSTLGRRTLLSLFGNLAPTGIGVAGTVVAATASDRAALTGLLLAWTVLGYLTLSDFGLTRTASKQVASGLSSPAATLRRLWRTASVLGALLSLGTAGALAVIARLSTTTDLRPLAVMCILPVISALQFPVVGVLEGLGRFGALVLHRLGVATFGYLVPSVAILAADGGLWIAVLSIVTSRAVATVLLLRALGLPPGPLVRAGRDAEPAITGPAVTADGGALAWIGVSSIVGPLVLYVDRGFLALAGVDEAVWVFYVSVSEILIKSYAIPAGVVAALFPWLVANLRRRTRLIRTAVIQFVPVAVVAAGAAVGALAIVVPDGPLRALGLRSGDVELGRLLLAVCCACTLLNWGSQLLIATLHAADLHRPVALGQLAVLAPYVGGLAIVSSLGGALGVSLVWGGRIAVLFAVLWALAWIAVRRLAREGAVTGRRESGPWRPPGAHRSPQPSGR